MAFVDRTLIVAATLSLICYGGVSVSAGGAVAEDAQFQLAENTPASNRTLNDRQRDIIKHYVLREAKASIISSASGEPGQFARELESALKDAGAWVSVDTIDSVESGQTGPAPERRLCEWRAAATVETA